MSENSELVTTGNQAQEMVRQLPVAAPAVDIYENDAEILLHADMPGVLKDDISVHIDNGKMTLTGVRRLEESGATAWREFGEVEYRRTFAVPQSIDINKVHAVTSGPCACTIYGEVLTPYTPSSASTPR